MLAGGQKVIVFTCYTEGITRHKKALGDQAVTITGADNARQRMVAMDAFQKDPKVTEFMGGKPHPGKDLEKGYFGFAGHGDAVAFRKVAIRKL